MYDKDDLENIRASSSYMIDIAKQYHKSRCTFGFAKRFIDVSLAQAYRDEIIPPKLAYDKAIITLISKSEKVKKAYKEMVAEEQNYKGLEKIIDAIRSDITLTQSIIKYTKEAV